MTAAESSPPERYSEASAHPEAKLPSSPVPSLAAARAWSVPPSLPPGSEPPATRWGGEDFLFHLYRGSALLEENRVAEAKEELERALEHKPQDSEGQGLLGVVYFRLGLYPRAIAIYLEIVRDWPEAITPKLNLSLCYLKTGQPSSALALLDDVIQRVPDHSRAWGYRGLALERLDRLEEAENAFQRAGQPRLAARVKRQRERGSEPPSGPEGSREALRLMARDASLGLDGNTPDGPFLRDVPRAPTEPPRIDRWQPTEPGREQLPSKKRARPPEAPASLATIPPLEREGDEVAPFSARSSDFDLVSGLPLTALGVSRARLLDAPGAAAERTPEGLVVLRAEHGFAVRRERLRAVSQEAGGIEPVSLRRRVRYRETEEPFAGPSGGFTKLFGTGFVVLEPPSERELLVIELGEEVLYVRESRLVAFHGSLQYENGRLPVGETAPLAMVQLKGQGEVVVEVSRRLSALRVSGEGAVSVRAATVLGWTGRVVGQAPPSIQTGLWISGAVSFSGEGTLFVDDP